MSIWHILRKLLSVFYINRKTGTRLQVEKKLLKRGLKISIHTLFDRYSTRSRISTPNQGLKSSVRTLYSSSYVHYMGRFPYTVRREPQPHTLYREVYVHCMQLSIHMYASNAEKKSHRKLGTKEWQNHKQKISVLRQFFTACGNQIFLLRELFE